MKYHFLNRAIENALEETPVIETQGKYTPTFSTFDELRKLVEKSEITDVAPTLDQMMVTMRSPADTPVGEYDNGIEGRGATYLFTMVLVHNVNFFNQLTLVKVIVS